MTEYCVNYCCNCGATVLLRREDCKDFEGSWNKVDDNLDCCDSPNTSHHTTHIELDEDRVRLVLEEEN